MKKFITLLTFIMLFLSAAAQISFASPMDRWEIGLQNRSGGQYYQGFKSQVECEQDTGEECAWSVDECGNGYGSYDNTTYYASKRAIRAIYNYDQNGGVHAKEMMAGMIMSEFCSFPFSD